MRVISGLQILEVRFKNWNFRSAREKGTKMYEQLRKQKVDICCPQEISLRAQGAQYICIKSRKY